MTSPKISKSQKSFSLFVQANEFKRQADYRSAIATYQRAIAQLGESAELDATLAHCYFALAVTEDGTDRDAVDSVDWMKRAIALNPNNAVLYADLGQHLALAALDYAEAVRAYEMALALDPNNLRSLVGAAVCYGVPERVVTLEQAMGWLERATLLDPDNPNLHGRLVQLYLEADRLTDSIREAIRALLCPQPLDSGYVQVVAEATLRLEQEE